MGLDFEFEELAVRWERLPERVRGVILALGGVREIPGPTGEATRTYKKTRPGDEPEWLTLALTLLRDGGNRITDREIARRLNVSNSTLSRNATFRRARHSYREEGRRGRPPKIMRVGGLKELAERMANDGG